MQELIKVSYLPRKVRGCSNSESWELSVNISAEYELNVGILNIPVGVTFRITTNHRNEGEHEER